MSGTEISDITVFESKNTPNLNNAYLEENIGYSNTG